MLHFFHFQSFIKSAFNVEGIYSTFTTQLYGFGDVKTYQPGYGVVTGPKCIEEGLFRFSLGFYHFERNFKLNIYKQKYIK